MNYYGHNLLVEVIHIACFVSMETGKQL